MRVLLFLILPYPSHYMACFALAQELKRKGFKIVFTGNSKGLKELVTQNGFDYVQISYQNEYNITNIKLFFSFIIINLFSKKFLFERYREFYSIIIGIDQLLKLTKADTVFIDEHLYQYYFYFLNKSKNIFLLNTKLLTTKQGNNPPLNSKHIPQSTDVSKIVNELMWINVYLMHKLKLIKSKLAFYGKDDDFFINRFCAQQNINYKMKVNLKNTFYYGIKNVKKIILAPEYLDTFASKNEEYNHYICLEYNRIEDSMLNNSSYITLKAEITKNITNKVILCSFGTVINEKDRAKIDFLDRLNTAVKNENYLLIVVSKNHNVIVNKSPNVRVVPSIPQLDLLKSCDLMIHHAGLNTIKECLQFQVPMLIYTPKEKSFDRVGNAARIQFNGLGLVGNIYTDSPKKIKENIEKALLIKMPKQNYEQEYIKLNKFIDENLR